MSNTTIRYSFRANRYYTITPTGAWAFVPTAKGRNASVVTDRKVWFQGNTWSHKKVLKEAGLKWHSDSKSWGGHIDPSVVATRRNGQLRKGWTVMRLEGLVASGELRLSVGVEPWRRADGELSWHC